MKITKAEFDKLYSPDITKREYDEIVDRIDNRFFEIVKIMIPRMNRKGWLDYGNCDYDSEDSNGKFDLYDYKTEIPVGGNYSILPKPYEYGSGEPNGWMENSFPTRWLWEDFEPEFRQAVAKEKREELRAKELAKQKKELSKLKQVEFNKNKAEMRKSITSKLTPEELKYISFK